MSENATLNMQINMILACEMNIIAYPASPDIDGDAPAYRSHAATTMGTIAMRHFIIISLQSAHYLDFHNTYSLNNTESPAYGRRDSGR